MRWDRHGIRPSLGKSLLFEVVDVLCPVQVRRRASCRERSEIKTASHHGAICKP